MASCSRWPCGGRIGHATVAIGQAAFVGGGHTSIEVGRDGLTALVAYTATAPIGSLLQRLGEPSINPAAQAAAAIPQVLDRQTLD